MKNKTQEGIKPAVIVVSFVFIITLIPLMYQVINPAFEHLTLVSWHGQCPIVALAIMRNLLMSKALQNFVYRNGNDYGAFISFMRRNSSDYSRRLFRAPAVFLTCRWTSLEKC